MKKFDLHTHTTFSDGSKTPHELCQLALEFGLSGLSITDHDTVEAYSHLPKTALKIGIGVEFSSFHNDQSVHILGYDFILDHPSIKRLCERHSNRRLNRNRDILKNLKSLGIVIDENVLYERFKERSLGRPHIAQVLVEQGVCQSIDHAFREYLAEGKKAYAKGDMISVQETLNVIHEADGKAFLAHPHLIKKSKLVKELTALDFDGVEVFYAKYPKSEVLQWQNLAQQKKWLISGGSDYHGDFKTFNQLGSSWIEEPCFDMIFKRPILSDS